jgi:predicted transposase/invertase (TIGR01784 family)
MKELLDPKNDIVFKLLFSKTKNKELLISFLTAVLKPESAISEITILNPQIPLQIVDDKCSILDLVVKLSNKTHIDVEMQMAPTPDFKKRLLYYWAKLHSTQLETGEGYLKLSPTITIAILAYNEFKDDNEAHTIFELRDQRTHKLYLPDMQLHFLELPKLDWTDGLRISYSSLYDWMRFFVASDNLEDLSMSSEIMKKAVDALKELSEDEEARQLALMREKTKINRQLILNGAFEDGMAKGLMEGETRGELKERHNNIKKMLAKGMTAQEIAELLEIPIEEIVKL